MTVKSIPALTERPAHVPPELVYDVDIFNLEGANEDVHLAWKRVQREAPPIFWTPRNGGYWMITRGKDIEEVQKDHEHFSMKAMLIPNVPRPFPAPPLDFEPPEHGPWRLLVSPAFSPKVIAEVEETVKQTTISLIEGFAANGECEFVTEFTKVLPIVVFLRMMNLPLEDRHQLMAPADAIARSPHPEQIHSARLALKAYIQSAVDARKAEPHDDLISKIMNSKIKGEPIAEEYVVGMCTLLLSGGLDTVKNMLGFCAKFLATHPDHVRQLRENPALIPHAIEELIRRHGVSNTARLIVKDYEFLGVQLKAGEQLQGVTALVGLDDDTVPDPMTVDFNRPAPIPHAAFGNGPHRCPGSILARRELKVWLEEWLPRIPEFQIKPGTVPRHGAGMVNNVSELWLSWTPKSA
ncbi:Cytochrome P450 [Pseudomonas sp. 9AZ]|uniref:cytochrome P450 n=1 Tax=Pseudomonas sp. 9AZ TaxID=2653168 RepID=UPI0012F04ECF|nr:cytochrome P450 [Pseudomonas sp. 9AZ]VXD04122.1 Cytochrome P450 [Pseudomonas sp. 9AZ]